MLVNWTAIRWCYNTNSSHKTYLSSQYFNFILNRILGGGVPKIVQFIEKKATRPKKSPFENKENISPFYG